MAGPDTAPELVQRLDEDLTRVHAALCAGKGDRAVLHAQSHILLSIAGTIGATLVYELAKRLNAVARGDEAGDLAATLAPIQAALAELIQRIRASAP